MKDQQIHRTFRPRTSSAKLVTAMLAALLFSATPMQSVLAQSSVDTGTAAGFAVIGGTAVTLTDATVIGDVGSPIAVTVTRSEVDGTVYPVGDPAVFTAYNDFQMAYDALKSEACVGTLLDGNLAGLVLTPGTYCIEAASTTTNGVLTLDGNGDADASWLFMVGTLGTGALTGTSLTVVMDNGAQPCNVTWWVAEAVTMTSSNFIGNILAGAATTFTGGSLTGQVLSQAGVTMTDTDTVACDKFDGSGNKSCKHHGKNKHHDKKGRCNQGVGNGPEDCDPGRSNHGDDSNSNDEHGGTPGDPGRKGHDDDEGHDDD